MIKRATTFDAGKARPIKRTLLSSLMVCKRCGSSFTTIRDRRWPGPTGEGYRCYTCSGYHRYGKSVCGVTNVPGPALDVFVLQTIKRVLLGDHKTTKKAIEAFVAAVLAPKAATRRNSKSDHRELELLNRKIKATIAMLGDPKFDGLDELRTTLADLKAKRDVLQAALTREEQPATSALSENELRTWALEQFARLDELATRTTVDLKDRQMVEAFVDRIEINPEAKTGVVYLMADLEGALLRSSTRGPIGDYLGILDKLSALPLAAPAIADLESIRRLYDGLTVTQWWQKVSGREELLERVLRPLCRAIQFTDADQFSAYDFLGWAHNSLYDLPNLRLAGYKGARDESIFAPLGKYLTDRGAEIRVNTQILEISYQPGTRTIRGMMLPSGERVEADAYVAAMPAWSLPALLPPSLRDQPFFAHIDKLPVAPAISVQLWFDRPISNTPEFHLVARSSACVYQEQSPHTYPVANGSRISVILSPADSLLSYGDEALVQLTLESLRKANPEVAQARVTKSVVLKHRKHLVRPLPGAMSARPSQITPIASLFLAGDWTQQEFFGSQEGAVRGGKYCAREIRRQLTPDAPEL